MKRVVDALSQAFAAIGERFTRREPGYFERKYKFRIDSKLLKKWSSSLSKYNHPLNHPFIKSRMYFPTSTHKISLPYYDGLITIRRVGSITEFQNWPYYGYHLEENRNMLRGDSIKVTGRDNALHQLKNANFLHQIKDYDHYVPEIIKEIENIVMLFGPYDLIIISHTKELKHILNENYENHNSQRVI